MTAIRVVSLFLVLACCIRFSWSEDSDGDENFASCTVNHDESSISNDDNHQSDFDHVSRHSPFTSVRDFDSIVSALEQEEDYRMRRRIKDYDDDDDTNKVSHSDHSLMVTLLMQRNCPHSQRLLGLLREVASQLNCTSESTDLLDDVDDYERQQFIWSVMYVEEAEEDFLNMLLQQKRRTPQLYFFRLSAQIENDHNEDNESLKSERRDEDDDKPSLVVSEYVGKWDTVEQLRLSFLHLAHRYEHGNVIQLENDHDADDLFPISALEERIISYLRSGHERLWQVPEVGSNYSGPIHPDYRPIEKGTISWLMNGVVSSTSQDPLIVFILGPNSMTDQHTIDSSELSNFERLCNRFGPRRDVVCFTVPNLVDDVDFRSCQEEPIEEDRGVVVQSWLLHPTSLELLRKSSMGSNDTLAEFFLRQTTPSVMFLDRRQTAPIAFPKSRKVHAALFVRLLEQQQSSKAAVDALQKACLLNRLNRDEDLVCLVIADTETRILTQFGIDIWTPFDQRATVAAAAVGVASQEKQETKDGGINDLLSGFLNETDTLLPVMVITDRRQRNGIHRFYLHADEIISDPSIAIEAFLDSFWKDELQPAVKSSQGEPRKNMHGVEIVNAASFSNAVMGRPYRHSLVVFTAPTCGHCKRFNTVWNQLAELVRDVGWDSFLDIQSLDVTKNDVAHIADPEWLPAVYYFYMDREQEDTSASVPIVKQYDVVDMFGDGPGRLGGPMDLIDWFLDVAGDYGIDEEALLRDLEKAMDDSDELSGGSS